MHAVTVIWSVLYVPFQTASLLIFNKQLKEQDPIYERSDNIFHLYVVLNSIMPAVACPFTGCYYITGDLEAAIVAALITVHSTTHAPGAPCPSARIENSQTTNSVCCRFKWGSMVILSIKVVGLYKRHQSNLSRQSYATLRVLRWTTTQRFDTLSRRKPHWQNSRWSHSRNQKTGSPGRKCNGRHSPFTFTFIPPINEEHFINSWTINIVHVAL